MVVWGESLDKFNFFLILDKPLIDKLVDERVMLSYKGN